MKTYFLKLVVIVVLTSSSSAFGQTKEKDLFPPIDIKKWEKTPCVNGRLATKKEAENGTALLYFDKKDGAKPYNMKLPALAYVTYIKIDKDAPADKKISREKIEELVVVIQIVKTPTDTMVAYRPLTGGNGASVFRDFRFLNTDEIKKLTSE